MRGLGMRRPLPPRRSGGDFPPNPPLRSRQRGAGAFYIGASVESPRTAPPSARFQALAVHSSGLSDGKRFLLPVCSFFSLFGLFTGRVRAIPPPMPRGVLGGVAGLFCAKAQAQQRPPPAATAFVARRVSVLFASGGCAPAPLLVFVGQFARPFGGRGCFLFNVDSAFAVPLGWVGRRGGCRHLCPCRPAVWAFCCEVFFTIFGQKL